MTAEENLRLYSVEIRKYLKTNDRNILHSLLYDMNVWLLDCDDVSDEKWVLVLIKARNLLRDALGGGDERLVCDVDDCLHECGLILENEENRYG